MLYTEVLPVTSLAIEKESLNKSFDRLRTNGKLLIPFVMSLLNHEWDQLNQSFQNSGQRSFTDNAMDDSYPQ